MKHQLSIIFLLLFNFSLFAQETGEGALYVKGTIKVDRATISGAKAQVYEDGKLVYTADATLAGKLDVKLNLNKNCEIVVTKIGFFPKRLWFNTNVPSADFGVYNYRFAMEMVREVEGFDASFWDEPIGKIKFDETLGDFDYDVEYTKSRQKRMNDMMKQYERLLQETYQRILSQADAAFNSADYDNAEKLYTKAIDYDPYDPYPDDQLLAIAKIRKQDNRNLSDYDKYIKLADNGFEAKSYELAKENYQKALEVNNTEAYPKEQIAKIDKLLAELAAKDSQLAELNKKYNTAITLGLQALTAQKYQEAKLQYTTANTLKPEEELPKIKLAEINALLAQLAADNANKAEQERQYKALITQADADFNAKNYVPALGKYQQAGAIKPAEQYPKQRIVEIENILAAQKDKDSKYNSFIALADQAFNQKSWDNAKNNYNAALGVKPNEQYPKDKIAEIDAAIALMAQQKSQARDESYKQAIAKADAAFNQKDYSNAKTLYNEAIAIKQNEAYPKQRIAEIDKLLGDMAAKRKAYDMAIAKADADFNVQKWESAKVSYQEALALFPTEQHPQTRITEIDNKLLAMKNAADQAAAREKAYAEAIQKADAMFNEKKYVEAKNSYNQALGVKPTEAYPKNRIGEIELILASIKANEEKYSTLIASADTKFNNKDYENSKSEYTQASLIKPNESYPKQRIAEIDAILLTAKQKRDADAKKQAEYAAALQKADGLYDQKAYTEALEVYRQASGIMPNETYPKERINTINSLLAGIAATEQKYKAAITKADALFGQKSYPEAKDAYSEALTLKPNEAYPKSKITEIDGLLASMRALDENYAAYIKSGDKMFTAASYEAAKAEYVKASGLKPNEAYPKQKIAEIDKLLLAEQQKQEAAAKLLAQYKETIAKADAAYNTKNWETALGLYQQAKFIKPDESYPDTRIQELNTMLAGLKETDAKYKQAITAGDNQYNSKQYAQAKASYTSAIELKPNESYPKEQLKLVDAALAKMAKDQAAYEKLIATADEAFTNKEFDNAKTNYEAALAVKPNETHPKNRLAEITALLAEQAKLREQQAKVDAQYKSLIADADQNFSQKKYNEAKGLYSQAALVKSSEIYPKERIAEIDRLVKAAADIQQQYDQKVAAGQAALSSNNLNGAMQSFMDASSLKPDENLPKQKIAEITALIGEKQKKQQQYDKLISQADNLFGSKKYTEAKPLYQQAAGVLVSESYPKEQIAKIDQLLAEEARKMAEQKAKEEQYNTKIATADKMFENKQYESAISAYMDAKSIKPGETYPDQQIAKINDAIKADKARLEAEYKSAMSKGKDIMAGKNYNDAKSQFQQALSLKPGDFEAEAKIAEVNILIEQQKANLAEQAKIEAKYNEYIATADKLFNANDYSGAKAFYNSALGVKANDSYAQQKAKLCDSKLKELADKQAAEEEAKRKAAAEAAASSFKKNEFDYQGEKRDNTFLNDLAKQYPEGKTVENYDKPGKTIKRVIMNHGGIAKEYIEVKYSYGTFYFRNGNNISQGIFYSETK